MSYHKTLTSHLGTYRESILKIRERGAWEGTERDHILPKDRNRDNIVGSIRDSFWRYAADERLTTSLHRDFHHLTSSQAFAFNLFFPIFGNQDATNIVLNFAALPEQRVKWKFEQVPDEDEKTNFDVLGFREDRKKIYGEVKLSEREFGTCKLNPKRREKRDDKYRPDLAAKIPDELFEDRKFQKNYQLLRNLSYLESHDDRLLLVVPRKNERTFRQAETFIQAVLPEWRESVVIIAAKDLIDRLGHVPAISPTMAEVQQKYVIA